MDFNFDIRGNLIPHGKSIIDLDTFQEIFVDSFDKKSSRHIIFKNYQSFINDFKSEVTTNFTHWIDGSFVSNKENPNDIDFVTLIDAQTFFKNEVLIDKKFRLKGAKNIYNVDAYTIILYSENHKKHFLTKSDSAYWYNWFSKTKKNWQKQSFNKGFLEINFK